MPRGFTSKYPRLFSGEPFDNSGWSRTASHLPEVRRLNQRARMNEFRSDLRQRVRQRIAAQRAEREPTQ